MRDRDVEERGLLLAEHREVLAVHLRDEPLDVRRVVLDAARLRVEQEHQVVRQQRLLAGLGLVALVADAHRVDAVEARELLEREARVAGDRRRVARAHRGEALDLRRGAEPHAVRDEPRGVRERLEVGEDSRVGVCLGGGGPRRLDGVVARGRARKACERADYLAAHEDRPQVGDGILLGLRVVVELVAVEAERQALRDRVLVDGLALDGHALEVRADRAHVLVVLDGGERLGVVHLLEAEALRHDDGLACERLQRRLELAVGRLPSDGVLRERLGEELVVHRALVGEKHLAGLRRRAGCENVERIRVHLIAFP